MAALPHIWNINYISSYRDLYGSFHVDPFVFLFLFSFSLTLFVIRLECMCVRVCTPYMEHKLMVWHIDKVAMTYLRHEQIIIKGKSKRFTHITLKRPMSFVGRKPECTHESIFHLWRCRLTNIKMIYLDSRTNTIILFGNARQKNRNKRNNQTLKAAVSFTDFLVFHSRSLFAYMHNILIHVSMCHHIVA